MASRASRLGSFITVVTSVGQTPFLQTNVNFTHRYGFGKDDRFTMALDLNILNIWDQATVRGIYPTMNTTIGGPNDATIFPPPIPAAQRPVLYASSYTTGALLQPILNHLNADRNHRLDQRYKLPQLYQAPRTVRFGLGCSSSRKL